MAITQNLNLPDQPAIGEVEYIPLAGNGKTSPRSAYLGNFQVVGDATGGLITLSVFRDPRFEHIVSFLSAEKLAVAAFGFRMSLGRASISTHNIGITLASQVTGDAVSSMIYAPVATIDAVHWQLRVENTDTVVTRFKFLVYNFDVAASLNVPLPVLLASLPRAPTVV